MSDPKENIRTATARLDRAQTELTEAVEALPTADRADKQIVTRRLQKALSEIGAAKAALQNLLDGPEPVDP